MSSIFEGINAILRTLRNPALLKNDFWNVAINFGEVSYKSALHVAANSLIQAIWNA